MNVSTAFFRIYSTSAYISLLQVFFKTDTVLFKKEGFSPSPINNSGFQFSYVESNTSSNVGGSHAEGQPYVYVSHNEIRAVWCPHPRPPLIP